MKDQGWHAGGESYNYKKEQKQAGTKTGRMVKSTETRFAITLTNGTMMLSTSAVENARMIHRCLSLLDETSQK
jgi:hypothetical protein